MLLHFYKTKKKKTFLNSEMCFLCQLDNLHLSNIFIKYKILRKNNYNIYYNFYIQFQSLFGFPLHNICVLHDIYNHTYRYILQYHNFYNCRTQKWKLEQNIKDYIK